MIFLIDDNKYGQMEQNYKFDFTSISQLHPEHITWLRTVGGNMEMILKTATCILIHDSIEPKEDKERLVATTVKNRVPYCIFSNGFTATIFDGDSIKAIKKDRLYNNLSAFIKNCREQGKIDLRQLSLGQNYEAEKASIIQDRLINGVLFKNREHFNYEAAFPTGSQEYKDLRELVYLSNSSIDYSDFEEEYNSFEEEYNCMETSAETMREVIINLAKSIKRKYE